MTVSMPNVIPIVNVATVCHSGSGTLYLSGHTGNVVRWEYSTTGGTTWLPIANTAITYNYSNIITSLDFAMLRRLYDRTPGLASDKLKHVLEIVWASVAKVKCQGRLRGLNRNQVIVPRKGLGCQRRYFAIGQCRNPAIAIGDHKPICASTYAADIGVIEYLGKLTVSRKKGHH